jgi:hypothetical protein
VPEALRIQLQHSFFQTADFMRNQPEVEKISGI